MGEYQQIWHQSTDGAWWSSAKWCWTETGTSSQDLHVTFEKKEAPSQIKKRLGRKNGMDFIIILGPFRPNGSHNWRHPKLDASGYLVIFLHMYLYMYCILSWMYYIHIYAHMESIVTTSCLKIGTPRSGHHHSLSTWPLKKNGTIFRHPQAF